jgi:hypothetical protein
VLLNQDECVKISAEIRNAEIDGGNAVADIRFINPETLAKPPSWISEKRSAMR